jgi:hypothetical protein
MPQQPREREVSSEQPPPRPPEQGQQIDETTITTIALLVQRGEITAAQGRALLGLRIEEQPQLDSETITKIALLVGQGKMTAAAGRAFLGITHEQPLGLKSAETPAPTSASVQSPVEIYGWKMLADDRIITRAGIRYFPLPLAAWLARASEPTVRAWIDKHVKFGGRPLKTLTSPATKGLYLSQDSVERMANRFVKWPSLQPAGAVTLGETDDQTGYLAMSDASRIIGVSPRTMWLWASQGKAPSDNTLDVIKCTTSENFYVREKDVYGLKAVVPRSGLQRGRRPQLAPEP